MAEHRPCVLVTWMDGHYETFHLDPGDSWELDHESKLLRFKKGRPQTGRTEIPLGNVRHWQVFPNG